MSVPLIKNAVQKYESHRESLCKSCSADQEIWSTDLIVPLLISSRRIIYCTDRRNRRKIIVRDLGRAFEIDSTSPLGNSEERIIFRILLQIQFIPVYIGLQRDLIIVVLECDVYFDYWIWQYRVDLFDNKLNCSFPHGTIIRYSWLDRLRWSLNCVIDKPIHGNIETPGLTKLLSTSADSFYQLLYLYTSSNVSLSNQAKYSPRTKSNKTDMAHYNVEVLSW